MSRRLRLSPLGTGSRTRRLLRRRLAQGVCDIGDGCSTLPHRIFEGTPGARSARSPAYQASAFALRYDLPAGLFCCAYVGASDDLDNARASRRLILDVARAVAVAHREGGLLRIGGEQVSDAEHAALAEIEAALGGRPAGGDTA
jgi:hypothetical protein